MRFSVEEPTLLAEEAEESPSPWWHGNFPEEDSTAMPMPLEPIASPMASAIAASDMDGEVMTGAGACRPRLEANSSAARTRAEEEVEELVDDVQAELDEAPTDEVEVLESTTSLSGVAKEKGRRPRGVTEKIGSPRESAN